MRGQVTIAALPSIAAGMLPRIVARFAHTHPEVEVRIHEGFDADVLRMVRNGSADMAITDSGNRDDDLEYSFLLDDPVVAVLHPDSPLAALKRVTWGQLASYPFVAFATGSSVRRLAELGFAGNSPAHTVEAGAISTAAGMVGAGLGVTAVPETVVPLMAFAPLVTRPLDEPTVIRRLALHSRRQPPLAPAARDFAALVRESVMSGENSSA